MVQSVEMQYKIQKFSELIELWHSQCLKFGQNPPEMKEIMDENKQYQFLLKEFKKLREKGKELLKI